MQGSNANVRTANIADNWVAATSHQSQRISTPQPVLAVIMSTPTNSSSRRVTRSSNGIDRSIPQEERLCHVTDNNGVHETHDCVEARGLNQLGAMKRTAKDEEDKLLHRDNGKRVFHSCLVPKGWKSRPRRGQHTSYFFFDPNGAGKFDRYEDIWKKCVEDGNTVGHIVSRSGNDGKASAGKGGKKQAARVSPSAKEEKNQHSKKQNGTNKKRKTAPPAAGVPDAARKKTSVSREETPAVAARLSAAGNNTTGRDNQVHKQQRNSTQDEVISVHSSVMSSRASVSSLEDCSECTPSSQHKFTPETREFAASPGTPSTVAFLPQEVNVSFAQDSQEDNASIAEEPKAANDSENDPLRPCATEKDEADMQRWLNRQRLPKEVADTLLSFGARTMEDVVDLVHNHSDVVLKDMPLLDGVKLKTGVEALRALKKKEEN